MIDRDLAELYGVETRVLKQAVRRNIERFPEDFMFEMNKEEFDQWREENITASEDKHGLRYAPFCFTEQGVTMLSCVLNSKRAIQVNIQVIRIFTRLREMVLTHKDILLKLEQLERKVWQQDGDIKLIFKGRRIVCLKVIVPSGHTPTHGRPFCKFFLSQFLQSHRFMQHMARPRGISAHA
jgi:hypothetical protein